MNDSVTILHEGNGVKTLTSPLAMRELSGDVPFDLKARVPGVAGQAFDFQRWAAAWLAAYAPALSAPGAIKLLAADTYEATVPWEQLGRAAWLYAEADGSPLHKGGPLRLYVPDGTSSCLNVKHVVGVNFLPADQPSDRLEASYGFKNTFSPQDLRTSSAT